MLNPIPLFIRFTIIIHNFIAVAYGESKHFM